MVDNTCKMRLISIVLLAIGVVVECMPKSDVELLGIEKSSEGLNSTNNVDQGLRVNNRSSLITFAKENKTAHDSNLTTLENMTLVLNQTDDYGNTAEPSIDKISTNNESNQLEKAENNSLYIEGENESIKKDTAFSVGYNVQNIEGDKPNKTESTFKLEDNAVINRTSEKETDSGNQYDLNNSTIKNHEEKKNYDDQNKYDLVGGTININKEIKENIPNSIEINDDTKQNKSDQKYVNINREIQTKQEEGAKDQTNNDSNMVSTETRSNQTIASKGKEEITTEKIGMMGIEENNKTGTEVMSKVKNKKKSDSDEDPKSYEVHKINFHKDVLRMLDRDEKMLGLIKNVQSSSSESIEESYKASELAKLRKEYLLSLAQSIHNSKIVADEYGHPRLVSPHPKPGAKILRAALRYGHSPISSHYANVQFVDEKFGNLPSLFGPSAKLENKFDFEDKRSRNLENLLYDSGRSRNAIRSLFDTNFRNKYAMSKSAANLQLSPYEWRERFRKQVKMKDDHKIDIESPVKRRDQIFKLDKIDPMVKDAIFSRSVKDILKASQNSEKINLKPYSKEKSKIKQGIYTSGQYEENFEVSKSKANDITIHKHDEALTYADGRDELFKPIIAEKPHFEVSQTAYDASKDLFSQINTNTINFAQNVFNTRVDSGNTMHNMLDNSKYTIHGSSIDVKGDSKDIVSYPFDKTGIYVNSDKNKDANSTDLEITTAASNTSKEKRDGFERENITDSISIIQVNSSHIEENLVNTDYDTISFQNLNNTTSNANESLDTSNPTTVTVANPYKNKSTFNANASDSKNTTTRQTIDNNEAISTNFSSKSNTSIEKSVIDSETLTNLTSEVVIKDKPENKHENKDTNLKTTLNEGITNKTHNFNNEFNVDSPKSEIKPIEAAKVTAGSTSNIEVTSELSDRIEKTISRSIQTLNESNKTDKDFANYTFNFATTITSETQIPDMSNVKELNDISQNISDTSISLNDSNQVAKNLNGTKFVDNTMSSLAEETDNATELIVLAIDSNKTEVKSPSINNSVKSIVITPSVFNVTSNDETKNNSKNINYKLNDLTKETALEVNTNKTVLDVTTIVYDSSLDSILVNATEKPEELNEASATENTGNEADNSEKISSRSVPDNDDAFNLDNNVNKANKTDDFISMTFKMNDTTTTTSTEAIVSKSDVYLTNVVENDANKEEAKSKLEANAFVENNHTLIINESKETLYAPADATDNPVKDQSNNITDFISHVESNQTQNYIKTSTNKADTKDLSTTTEPINLNDTNFDFKLKVTSSSTISADLNNFETTTKETKTQDLPIPEVKVDSDDAVKTSVKRELNLSEEPVPSISEANEAGSSDNTTITGIDTTITTDIISENKTSADRLGNQDQTTEFITIVKTETPFPTMKLEIPTTTIVSEKPSPEIIVEKSKTIKVETQPTSIDTFLKTVKSDREKEESKNEIDSTSKSEENISKSVSAEGVIYTNLDSINLEDSASLEALRR